MYLVSVQQVSSLREARPGRRWLLQTFWPRHTLSIASAVSITGFLSTHCYSETIAALGDSPGSGLCHSSRSAWQGPPSPWPDKMTQEQRIQTCLWIQEEKIGKIHVLKVWPIVCVREATRRDASTQIPKQSSLLSAKETSHGLFALTYSHLLELVEEAEESTLGVWERALASRLSNIASTLLQRRRATPSDNTKCKEQSWNISDQAKIPACQPLTSMYIELHGIKVLSVTTESVNLV